MASPAERGFTLVELLVALAVFSLAVMALLNLTGENLRTAGALEQRLLAQVVAENRAVEALTAPTPPALGGANGEEPAGGRTWRWRRDVAPTADPDILRVVVTVAPEDSDRIAAEVVVFRGRP